MQNKKSKTPTDKDLMRACELSYKNDKSQKKIDGLHYYNNFENKKTGFYADVYYNDDNIVFVFRGTEISSPRDVMADIALKKGNMPAQFYDGIKLYDRLQDSPVFRGKTAIATGHSLGGSITDYIGTQRGDRAVAFSPYGIGDIVKNPRFTDNITNYGNPRDPVFMENYENQIGNNKYVFNSSNYSSESAEYNKDVNLIKKGDSAFNHYHLLENMGDIDYASDDITGKDSLKRMTEGFKRGEMSSVQEMVYKNTVHRILKEQYEKTKNNENNCPGYVDVSSYTRNGKEISGYTRDCPYH